MQNISHALKVRKIVFAAEYRGLQHAVRKLAGGPQPPCYYCTDQQIWNCSKTGEECHAFTRYYSNYDL